MKSNLRPHLIQSTIFCLVAIAIPLIVNVIFTQIVSNFSNLIYIIIAEYLRTVSLSAIFILFAYRMKRLYPLLILGFSFCNHKIAIKYIVSAVLLAVLISALLKLFDFSQYTLYTLFEFAVLPSHIILSSVWEELAFRVILINLFCGLLNKSPYQTVRASSRQTIIISILASSLVFSLFHLSMPINIFTVSSVLIVFVWALLLSCCYIHTKSSFWTMLLHASINTTLSLSQVLLC